MTNEPPPAVSPAPVVPSNFLALPPEQSSLATARAVVVPVPYDATSSYRRGASLGPAAILQASRQMEDYDVELGGEPCTAGIATAAELEPHAAGPQWMVDRVAEAAGTYLDQGKLVGLLGGEHSITVGGVTAAARRFRDLVVLYLDAHADLRSSYQGSAFSHACAARRVREMCPLVLVGVRSLALEERRALARLGIPVFYRGADPVDEVTYARALQRLSGHVYVSVDLDVLDPSLMPSVGNPEPGGLGWWELLGLLRTVGRQCQIVGFDVTELCPRDDQDPCAYMAAKLVYKLIGYSQQHQRRAPSRRQPSRPPGAQGTS